MPSTLWERARTKPRSAGGGYKLLLAGVTPVRSLALAASRHLGRVAYNEPAWTHHCVGDSTMCGKWQEEAHSTCCGNSGGRGGAFTVT